MSRPLPPVGVWIDERLVVADSSIAGRGLFFAEHVDAGTVAVRFGGRLVSSIELESLFAATRASAAAAYVDTITVFEDALLVLPSSTPIHFANHSCDPTLWHVGPYALTTRRPVSAGEEATVDYGTQSGADGFMMTCRCGAVACRGVVTSDDWKRADLQERYRGHWVPALAERIERR